MANAKHELKPVDVAREVERIAVALERILLLLDSVTVFLAAGQYAVTIRNLGGR